MTTFGYNLDGALTNILSPEGWIGYEYDVAMGSMTRAYTTNSEKDLAMTSNLDF